MSISVRNSSLANTTVLIAGGSGFIGQHLCKYFLDKGYSVISWDLPLNKEVHVCTGHPNFRREERNINQSTDCDTSNPIDFVLHFASYVSPRDFMSHPEETLLANSEGTRNLLSLAAKKKARFLFSSSAGVYRGEDPTKPRAIYEQAKRFGEAMVSTWARANLIEARIVRMWQCYGPGARINDGHVIPTFIRQALKNEEIRIMGGNQLSSFTYIDDVINGIATVLFSDDVGPVDLGVMRQVSINFLAQTIISLCGSRSEQINTWEKMPDEKTPDLAAAQKLGWVPKVEIEEGLKRTVEDFRERMA